LFLGFGRGLPDEEIRRDGRAEDSDERGQEVAVPLNLRNENASGRWPPRHVNDGKRDDIGEEAKRQPFEDGDIAVVVEEYLRQDGDRAERHHIKDAGSADEKLQRIGHGAKVGRDVDRIGDEEKNDKAPDIGRAVIPADIACDAMAGDATDAARDFLDGDH
jgi:hypothetical protein